MFPKKIKGISYSFIHTQSAYNPFYQTVKDQQIENELDRLDAVDVLVDEMLTYPDAEAIINKITKEMNND